MPDELSSDELKVIPMRHKDVEAKVSAGKMEEWFYTDIVKDHFFNPRNLVKSEEDLKNFSADGYGSVGSAACVLPSTLIQGKEGLSKISKLNSGDEVLSHDSKFHKVTQVFSPEYNEELLIIENDFGSITITKAHLVYAIKNSIVNKYKNQSSSLALWIHAGELEVGNITLYPIDKAGKLSAKELNDDVLFDGDYIYLPIRDIKKVDFNGRLKNLEVDESHTYTTDAFLIHNCGDKMDMWIKVDKENDKIVGCLFKTFGCGSAIASTSMLTVMVTENGGMPIEQALKIKPQDIVKRLGDLPQRKFHCSVLGDKALRQAINDYFRKTGQYDRIIIEGAQVIDMILKITDKDIEEAVLDGAHDFEAVQKKTKVGIQDKSCIPKVKELIEFYKKKYYG